MSQDQVSVTTNTNWFSRLGNALKGVVFGLVLVLVSIVMLSWNENRSISSIRTNNEGARTVVSVAPDRVDSANEGKLVHVSAPASAEGQRRDERLGLISDGLLLKRSVEYFQWVETSQSETRKKLGGGEETVTTYTYTKEWTNAPQDTTRFNQPAGHENPSVVIKDEEFVTPEARIGAFKADANVIGQLSANQTLTPTAEQVQAAGAALGKPAVLEENRIFVGANAANPQPGDMRITYSYLPQNTAVSVIAAQTQGQLAAYPTKAGNPILMVRTGTASAEEMFQAAKAANKTMTWVLRGVGVVLMIVAFGMVLGPLGVLGDVVPFIGSIVRMGTGLIATILGVAISLVVIAVAWIVVRPVIGIGLLVLAGAAVGGLLFMRKRKTEQAPSVAV